MMLLCSVNLTDWLIYAVILTAVLTYFIGCGINDRRKADEVKQHKFDPKYVRRETAQYFEHVGPKSYLI